MSCRKPKKEDNAHSFRRTLRGAGTREADRPLHDLLARDLAGGGTCPVPGEEPLEGAGPVRRQ